VILTDLATIVPARGGAQCCPHLTVVGTTVSGMALESSPQDPQPLRAVTQAVKGWIERLGWVWVEGQLIEINRRSGAKWAFLTLRDKLAEVSVSISVSPVALAEAGPLPEGATVVAHLKPSFYSPNGRFSFYCDGIRAVGEGQLLARLEQRRRALQAEGLFDPARKKRLPFLPSGIGLITGADSAAERDVVENARRRWPAVNILTHHALVQGPQAAEQVMAAVRQLDADPRVEVIVIARGGGSLEDLLPFSDEGLVRTIAACRTPVVSAIGHEQDMPIIDLVADLRASTPTDAAKRIVPDVGDEVARLDQARTRIRHAMDSRIRRQLEALTALRSRPVLADPTATYEIRHDQLTTLRQRAGRAVTHRLQTEQGSVVHLLARTRAMSPKATLERGYAILLDADNHAITSAMSLTPGDDVLAHVTDGRAALSVREIYPVEKEVR